MTGEYTFSSTQLHNLKIEHLLNLAKYYEIPVKKNIKKDKLVQLILGKQKNFVVYSSNAPIENGEPQISVRVRRILESNKGE